VLLLLPLARGEAVVANPVYKCIVRDLEKRNETNFCGGNLDISSKIERAEKGALNISLIGIYIYTVIYM